MTLLVVSELTKRFRRRRGEGTVAVDHVSFEVEAGSTLAIVGESGAGKSTVARLVLRLIEPDEGAVLLNGVDLAHLKPAELRSRRRDMQMVFQDPFTSLDPRYTVRRAVAEPLVVLLDLDRDERDARVVQKLEMVGLGPNYLERRSGQLSGGELQRVAIARALVVEPSLIVCDEPVAALDVSIRAQILNLLLDVQARSNVAYLFITHDLSTVKLIASDVAVMRRGKVVEHGPTTTVLTNPHDQYTRTLLDSIPSLPAALDRPERSTANTLEAVDPRA